MEPLLSMTSYGNGAVYKIGDPEGSHISICLNHGKMEFAIFDDNGDMLRDKHSEDHLTMSYPMPNSPRQFAMSILQMLDRAWYDDDYEDSDYLKSVEAHPKYES